MKINASLTGEPTWYLDLNSGDIKSDLSLEEKFNIDLNSIYEILHLGFPLAPHTTNQNLKNITLGISCTLNSNEPNFTYQFPYKIPKKSELKITLEEAIKKYHFLLSSSLESKLTNEKKPFLLQSAGKDSTSLAIALAEVKPGSDCITYAGGTEEDEVSSAKKIADYLGLKHHVLESNITRAYQAYLNKIPDLKSITGDFAFLSYFDILSALSNKTDTIIDGLGSDIYFGTPLNYLHKILYISANKILIPEWLFKIPIIRRNFRLCYLLSTLQMSRFERFFPGSRFSNNEILSLFGGKNSINLETRKELFFSEYLNTKNLDQKRAIAISIFEAGSAFAKGRFSTHSFKMQVLYPYCDDKLANFIHQLPHEFKTYQGLNKFLVREHIKQHFQDLPYVKNKGSFRFNLTEFANSTFDQVFYYSELNSDILPGASQWMLQNRGDFNNKYFASKFYLLAIVLPWLHYHKKQVSIDP